MLYVQENSPILRVQPCSNPRRTWWTRHLTATISCADPKQAIKKIFYRKFNYRTYGRKIIQHVIRNDFIFDRMCDRPIICFVCQRLEDIRWILLLAIQSSCDEDEDLTTNAMKIYIYTYIYTPYILYSYFVTKRKTNVEEFRCRNTAVIKSSFSV